MVKKNMDETNKGFMKHLGGLDLKKIDDTKYEFSVIVKELHLNTGKIAHGGFLLTELKNVSVRTGDAIAVFNAFFGLFI